MKFYPLKKMNPIINNYGLLEPVCSLERASNNDDTTISL